MASAQSVKPSTAMEACQPKTQHSSFGQKISEMTNKAFKGHHARHGSNPNQVQSYSSQSQVESNGHNGTKTETHQYGHTQTQHDKKHGVTKTHITVCVVQAEITETKEGPSPYGATTTCFGTPKKNRELNNKKDINLFQRIKNGMSRHNGEGNSSSSDSESDDEKKSSKTKTKMGATDNEKKSPMTRPKVAALEDEKKCPKPKRIDA